MFSAINPTNWANWSLHDWFTAMVFWGFLSSYLSRVATLEFYKWTTGKTKADWYRERDEKANNGHLFKDGQNTGWGYIDVILIVCLFLLLIDVTFRLACFFYYVYFHYHEYPKLRPLVWCAWWGFWAWRFYKFFDWLVN